MLEHGEDGVSLFSLLDSARFFALHAVGDDCFEALLADARRHFSAMGKARFCVFHDDHGDRGERLLSWYLQRGCKDLAPGKLWAIARHQLPDFLEHVHMLLVPRHRGDGGGSAR